MKNNAAKVVYISCLRYEKVLMFFNKYLNNQLLI